MFLTTLYNDKIINTEKIQEVRLTNEEYPKKWRPDYYEAGAYFIVLDYLNSKGEIETVFYKAFPIIDEDYADGYEYPEVMFGSKQDYLNDMAFEEAQIEMAKLCKKINRKPKNQNNKQTKNEAAGVKNV